MSVFSPEMEDLARRLLAYKAEHVPESGGYADGAVQVCQKLRVPIAKLAGEYGFSSLLSRALALAKKEVPSLQAVEVGLQGHLEGWDEVWRDGEEGATVTGGEVLVARLLGLLVTFIGDPLTLRLVRDAWPDLSEDGAGWLKRVES